MPCGYGGQIHAYIGVSTDFDWVRGKIFEILLKKVT